MTIAEIEAELVQLDVLVGREPAHFIGMLQRGQALRRREMLMAELKKMRRLASLTETFRERLSAFDDEQFDRLLTLDDAEFARLLS
jgi:hypothetical protein